MNTAARLCSNDAGRKANDVVSYRMNTERTFAVRFCGADGEAVVRRDGRRSSHAAVACKWPHPGHADVSGLWGSLAAAGSVPELPGLRLGGVRLERPVPTARLVGSPADGFGPEALADETEVVLQEAARVRFGVVAPDRAGGVGAFEDCEDVEFALGYFAEQVRPVGGAVGESGGRSRPTVWPGKDGSAGDAEGLDVVVERVEIQSPGGGGDGAKPSGREADADVAGQAAVQQGGGVTGLFLQGSRELA